MHGSFAPAKAQDTFQRTLAGERREDSSHGPQ